MLQIVFTKLLLHKLIQQQRDIRNIYHADSHILPENIDVNTVQHIDDVFKILLI